MQKSLKRKRFGASVTLGIVMLYSHQATSATVWPPVMWGPGISPHPDAAVRAQAMHGKRPGMAVSDTVEGYWFDGSLGNPAWATHKGRYFKKHLLSSYPVEELSWFVYTYEYYGWASPLLIDLESNGFQTQKNTDSVTFDIFASGVPVPLTWVDPGTDDGFLALDLNMNGSIDDGSELFGDGTQILETGQKAQNGYDALQQYDSIELGGDANGFLDSKDSVWQALQIWVDSNADGVSQAKELRSLSSYSIESIDLEPRKSRRKDKQGNLLPLWSWVKVDVDKGPRRRKMVDIYFRLTE